MLKRQAEYIRKNLNLIYLTSTIPKKNRTNRNNLMISGGYVGKKALQIEAFVTGVFCCKPPSLLNCYACYGLKSGNRGEVIK